MSEMNALTQQRHHPSVRPALIALERRVSHCSASTATGPRVADALAETLAETLADPLTDPLTDVLAGGDRSPPRAVNLGAALRSGGDAGARCVNQSL